jgi:hypothetical protein
MHVIFPNVSEGALMSLAAWLLYPLSAVLNLMGGVYSARWMATTVAGLVQADPIAVSGKADTSGR